MYAELHALSNFSFLRGASHPEELVTRAFELGYEALALTDECSVAGVVRAHMAAKDRGLKLLIGSEFTLEEGFRLVVIAKNRRGYAELCSLITKGRRSAEKGSYSLCCDDFGEGVGNCLALWVPGHDIGLADPSAWLQQRFPERAWIAVELLADGFDRVRLAALTKLGLRSGLPLVAAGDVHMHRRARRQLQDTLTAIRLKTTLARSGFALYPSGERHLRSLRRLRRLYPQALLDETLKIAAGIHFSLDELRYEYPAELVPAGETASSWLRKLTYRGAKRRWPEGVSGKVRKLLEHELCLIAELVYEPYFLTVHDIVDWARSKDILCQGRGSAANSAVCFCLGITEVDPARMSLLVERFISERT